MAFPRMAAHAERVIYRIGGLPVAVAGLLRGDSRSDGADPLHAAFVWRYWHPDGPAEWSELIGGIIVWPLALVLASIWFTWRNGAVVRTRNGKGIAAQLRDQFRFYFSAGVLAPWYYIFSLYDDDGSKRARGYLQRFETKPGIFVLLKRRRGSPLNDKARFADYCASRGIRCVETVMDLDGRHPGAALPDHDLFVKPSKGRGGKKGRTLGFDRTRCIRGSERPASRPRGAADEAGQGFPPDGARGPAAPGIAPGP
jgi:hypothetical protein